MHSVCHYPVCVEMLFLGELLERFQGQPIPNCPGRHVLRTVRDTDGPEMICRSRRVTRHRSPNARDVVVVTWLEGWGLISYAEPTARGFTPRTMRKGFDGSSARSTFLLAQPLGCLLLVPHPVLWTQVNATPPGVARAPRGPRSACDTRASRAARSCCTAPRTRSLRRVPP